MKKVLFSIVCTALVVAAIFSSILKSSPGFFWVYPLNRSECKLEAIELNSSRYTVRFNSEHIERAELSSGAPQLFVPIRSEDEYSVSAHFEDCESIESSKELIQKSNGYYIHISKNNIYFDRRF